MSTAGPPCVHGAVCARPPTTFPATLSLRPTSAASHDLPRLPEQG